MGDALTVFCLPLNRTVAEPALTAPVAHPRTQRHVGVLHLYLPAGRGLDAEERLFLDALLAEIVLAYESVTLHTQEQITLRQLQMLHTPEGDFSTSLKGLLGGLIQALDADFALIHLRATPDERLSAGNTACGSWEELPLEQREAILARAVLTASPGKAALSPEGELPAWLAMPLELPEGHLPGEETPLRRGARGILLVGLRRPHEFHPRQQAILQTIAAQAALLLENERLIRSLEYKVVIQERARLAREIHDGLAQTLAFLKLQAAQMQAYLAQGDLGRLGQVLKDNYQALAEAYLDTRQSIDNLRLTPQDGLESWLARIIAEFENLSGLPVECQAPPLNRQVSPEVQAQLMRILQEALSNVRKHARARTVRVSLREWSGELILEVSDDGLGFEPEDVPEVSRYGLRGMRERAELIGADFQIISKAHQGTTVRLVLPVWFPEETLE